MKKQLVWITTLVFVLLGTLTACTEVRANPLPFLETGKVRTEIQAFYEIYTMPIIEPARIHFFAETRNNLQLTELDAKVFVEKGLLKIWPASEIELLARKGLMLLPSSGPLSLRTAGLEGNGVNYWRVVKGTELIVFLVVDGKFAPWFLLRCGNPVKFFALTPKKEVATETPPQRQPCCTSGCKQGYKVFTPSPTVLYSNRHLSHEFNAFVTETICR